MSKENKIDLTPLVTPLGDAVTNWSSYTKVYTFRDCFDIFQVEGEFNQINDLIKNGCLLITDALSISTLVDYVNICKSSDTNETTLCFYKGKNEIARVSTYYFKEVQLHFEIEENIKTRELKLHYCYIKPFKEYQM